jgi:hypothetical protein
MNDCLPTARRTSIALLVAGALAAPGAAAARDAPRWATGTALQERLNSPVDIVWADNPLRHAVGSLSRSQGVAVLIDRRIDPDQKLDLHLEGVTVRAVMEEIARRRGLGVSLLGPVLFLGPPGATARLRTLSALREEDVRRLPKAAAEKLTRTRPMAWDDLATPRELIEKLAGQAGVEVTGWEHVPHDLWAAADLPPLSWADRLTLIATQLDLTFAISGDGREVRLVPVPDRVAIVRSYPGGADAEATARKLAALVPGAEVRPSAGRVYVRGLVEEQERIVQPRRPAVAPKPPARQRAGLDRYSLTVTQQPVGRLLEQLAQQLKLGLSIDREAIQRAGISLDQRVSFRVDKVTVDELLEAAAKPAGLRAQRRGKTIEVGPAKP